MVESTSSRRPTAPRRLTTQVLLLAAALLVFRLQFPLAASRAFE